MSRLDHHIPRSTLPKGTSGLWEIEHAVVPEKFSRLDRIRGAINGHGRYARPGPVTILKHKKCVVMSDTVDERRDHLSIVRQARGDCLITGLGMGVVLNAFLIHPQVDTITVVEISEDVVKLVWKHIIETAKKPVRLVMSDALTWRPAIGTKYHTVWHDIWPTICEDNLEDMKKLTRAFAARLHYGGVQQCWCKSESKGRE